VKVISRKILREFWNKHSDAETALRLWEIKVRKADWKNFHDVKEVFRDADAVGDDRIIFNIKGNHYQLIAIVVFRNHRVYIRWIGTHKAYDKINVFDV